MIVFPAILDSYIIDTTPMPVFGHEKQNRDLIKTEKGEKDLPDWVQR